MGLNNQFPVRELEHAFFHIILLTRFPKAVKFSNTYKYIYIYYSTINSCCWFNGYQFLYGFPALVTLLVIFISDLRTSIFDMAEEALRSTSLRANFHRLTQLLMCGGVQLFPLRNRAHWKASPEKSGVPMMLCGRNDLGMRLQTLTANFGRFRSELTNSQTGVVKFRFASV